MNNENYIKGLDFKPLRLGDRPVRKLEHGVHGKQWDGIAESLRRMFPTTPPNRPLSNRIIIPKGFVEPDASPTGEVQTFNTRPIQALRSAEYLLETLI